VDTSGRADDLLTIGRFARLTGLSVGALRHYDELDVLRPAETDAFTGYRRYRRAQLETGRTIARLRELEVPLDEIRLILATDDPVEQLRLVASHRARVEARAFQLQRVLHHTSQIVNRKEPLVAAPTTTPELDRATQRALAVGLFNHTWTLLEKADRTAAETDEMIHSAHASRYHWGQVGEAVNLGRGEWQCARVYSVLRRGEPALWHARRCVEITEANADREDWDLAAAYEAMARALAVSGDLTAAAEWKAKAEAALATIAEPEDREQIGQDIATIPV
jgi:DNA-binding transcriptional MerR regulator